MEEKTCSACKSVTNDWKEWYHCKGCGTHYCPDCYSKHLVDHVAEEKGEREAQKKRQIAMEKGDFDTKKRALCPQCETHLTQMYF